MVVLAGCGGAESSSPTDGDEDPPITAAPSPAPRTLAIARYHGCVVVDGGVKCFGSDNVAGQLGPAVLGATSYQRPVAVPGMTDAVEVAVGDSHSCARHVDGSVSCWGANRGGALGAPASSPCGEGETCRATPEKVTGLTDAVRIVAASTQTCALRADGTVSCWGKSPVREGSETPKPVPFAERLVDIAFGPSWLCGVTTGSRIRCFSGDGTERSWLTHETYDGPVVTGATSFAWGQEGMLVLRGSTLSVGGREAPLFGEVAQVAGVDRDVACALLARGAVRCWGWEMGGRLGNGVTSGVFTDPRPVLHAHEIPGLVANDVAVSDGWSCARAAGTLTCWGVNAPIVGEDVDVLRKKGRPFTIAL